MLDDWINEDIRYEVTAKQAYEKIPRSQAGLYQHMNRLINSLWQGVFRDTVLGILAACLPFNILVVLSLVAVYVICFGWNVHQLRQALVFRLKFEHDYRLTPYYQTTRRLSLNDARFKPTLNAPSV